MTQCPVETLPVPKRGIGNRKELHQSKTKTQWYKHGPHDCCPSPKHMVLKGEPHPAVALLFAAPWPLPGAGFTGPWMLVVFLCRCVTVLACPAPQRFHRAALRLSLTTSNTALSGAPGSVSALSHVAWPSAPSFETSEASPGPCNSG